MNNDSKLIGETLPSPININSFVEIRALIRNLENLVTVNVGKGTSKQNNDFKDYQRPITWKLIIKNSDEGKNTLRAAALSIFCPS